jgi:hypothetical protein
MQESEECMMKNVPRLSQLCFFSLEIFITFRIGVLMTARKFYHVSLCVFIFFREINFILDKEFAVAALIKLQNSPSV